MFRLTHSVPPRFVGGNWPLVGKNKEPTGITWNEADGLFYISNDDDKTITRFDAKLNAPLGSVGTSRFGVSDPEDVASDPSGEQFNNRMAFECRANICGGLADSMK